MTRKPTRRKADQNPPPTQWLELSELLDYVGQVLGRGLPGAIWVRAEIAELTDRRHLYLDLVQLEGGQQVAKCRAAIWARERYALEGKLKRATGGGLSAGMSVLLFCTAEFHPQYGFSLHVQDIAPEFTLGEAVARLNAMRETLQAEGVYGLNRTRPLPGDYARLAVITPEGAAGLGDFHREVAPLEAAGVLELHYLRATFQGRTASESLTAAVQAAHDLHVGQPLDALVVIRGGGATTDLAWLNDLPFGRALAQFPAPVITGLGHARDDTLPDELAALRTDTPSKAAVHIVRTVTQAAAQAQADWTYIRRVGAEEAVGADASVRWLRDRLRGAVQRGLNSAERDVTGLMRSAVGLSPERTLERGYALVRGADGRPVTRAAQVGSGEALTLHLADGEIGVEVQ
ncbi:exodeoxyribonuclease VII large subunit [Deinococcus radiophilus]|uniref:Exodeoxyribonuclease 7 large subunit n=1 Tax=Deinococcus radiophilus TaxID=32062 RepID=A0A3S0RJF4_9DEIO|nr:exodeoxyribonuclease VII large subunit [Deinococcus radiophilus]RTR29872.1 exodeoxyribonuclease VII large subunit [Deinococcus radiophilus]UFA49776.1 exodeoxyribonuclease VII large subunit [Deinococcus radiophilus]